jgi:NADH-quinone oxidoreductase subunit J
MMTELLWWIFAPLATLSALLMVTRKNPVASLLLLVMTLFSLAVLFLLMQAHFIAAVQIIVYAGAIMVLFLFVIMLLNLGHDYVADLRGLPWLAVGSVVFGVMAWLLSRTFTAPTTFLEAGTGMLPEAALEQHGAVGAVALPLFREYVVGFEVTSLLLLAAIIGAILLAKRRV